MSVNSKMTAIADLIRTLMGETGKMGLDQMEDNLGNAVTEVDGQNNLIQQIKTALEGKAAGGGGGNVGGLTQYAKFTATPTSATSFSIVNPLGGIAKKVSIQRTVGTATSSRKCQKCLIDLELGIGIGEFIDTSGRVRYPVVLTNGTPSNGDFKISDGTIVVYRYNSANTWDSSNEYEVEIWQ